MSYNIMIRGSTAAYQTLTIAGHQYALKPSSITYMDDSQC